MNVSFSQRLQELKRAAAVRATAPLRLLGPRMKEAFGILMYHRVASRTPGVDFPTWNVTPERFRAQMVGLLARGYQAWPLRKVIEHRRSNRPIPRKTFVVTFDDGFANNYHNAWPILKELNIPATLFLATRFLDSDEPFPSDDWSAAGSDNGPSESWKPLTTQQCREMQDHGLIELAAHTHTHADFRNRPEALREDLLRCLDELTNRFGLTDATFAFPYGTKHLGFSGPVLAAAAKQAGVLSALTTEDELVTPENNPFDWGRFTAEQSDTSLTLATKLDGWYSFVRQMWRSFGKPSSSKTTPLPSQQSIPENRDIPASEPELVESR